MWAMPWADAGAGDGWDGVWGVAHGGGVGEGGAPAAVVGAGGGAGGAGNDSAARS